MTGQPTTPEQAETIRRYFSERIDSLKRSKIFYRDRLFKGADPYDPEIYDKIMEKHPESAIPLLMYQDFEQVYELLALLADSVIESEQNIGRLNKNLNLLAKKSKIDILSVMKNVSDLEKTILPAVKGMVNFFDGNKKEEEKRKKNGESMIV